VASKYHIDGVGLAVAMLASLAHSPAFADEANATKCSETYIRGQTLRNEHRLIEARETLRACVQSGCKVFVVRDCAAWLDQVQSSLPSVVPAAVDGDGNDLGQVKVSVDGKVLLERLDGRSVDVDPGPHTFVFEGPDAMRVEKQVIVAEGEKGKRIAVLFAKASIPATSGDSGEREKPPSSGTEMGPWKTAGLVTAGVGVVVAGIGGFFGLRAISKKNEANCDASSTCPTPDAATTLEDAQKAGNLATIFLVSGGVLTAGGITLFLLSPARAIRAVPTVGKDAWTMTIEGNW